MNLFLILVACVQPQHLQYDHGRALEAALAAQADRARPSAADAVFPLSGTEAAALRMNVEAATGDAEEIDTQALTE
jgi:hypothetical protein